MKLITIASGSKGNSYLLETEDGSLLIEAGIPINRIKKALGFNFTNIQGCLVTHEHKDHAYAIKDVAGLGIDVYASEGTFKAIDNKSHRYIKISHRKAIKIGVFNLLPFNTEHDALEPLGFLIEYKDKRLLFATDTFYLRYRFNNLTHIAIECNYIKEVMEERLNKGLIQISRVSRTLKSHMSLENLIEFLKSNDMTRVEEIHLLHLSDDNSIMDKIIKEVEKVTGIRPRIVG